MSAPSSQTALFHSFNCSTLSATTRAFPASLDAEAAAIISFTPKTTAGMSTVKSTAGGCGVGVLSLTGGCSIFPLGKKISSVAGVAA